MANPGPVIVNVNEAMEYVRVIFKLEWNLPGFRMLYDTKATAWSEGITMRELGVDDIEGRWRIYTDLANGVSFSLRFTDTAEQSLLYTGERAVFAVCSLRLSTGTGGEVAMPIQGGDATNTIISEWTKFVAGQKHSGCAFTELVNEVELLGNGDNDDGLLQDDCLHVCMEVGARCLGRTRTVAGLARPAQPVTTGFTKRQLEWLQKGDSRKPTDFIICSNDGTEFHVHRSLLDTHSPVFEAMVTHDMQERQLSRCDLKDEDGESVGLLLDYLYAGEVNTITENTAEKMLSLADKYQLRDMDLRSFCELKLIETVNKETAVPLLVFASQRNLTLLVKAVLKVIPQSMGEILSNKQLVDLMNRDDVLMKLIMEHCAERAKLNAEMLIKQ